MRQTARTTKLLLDLSAREQGGTNTRKRAYLEETVALLNSARRFYLEFFLTHPDKLLEQVEVTSSQTGAVTERLISADKLLTWAEFQTVETDVHPKPLPLWNFSRRFPDFPNRYRRSVIKDCIGKAHGYLTALQNWQRSGNKKGKPGHPTAANHPTLYAGTFTLELESLDLRRSFVRLKVYNGSEWMWVNYPTRYYRYFEQRRSEAGWEQESPMLVLKKASAAIHFLQMKTITASKVVERKRDPDLVTVAVDLNVKQLAVITVRQHDQVIQTRFVSDGGLDQARFRHLQRIAKKQWQSGRPVKGEHSNQQLWAHLRRQNLDAAHKTARAIVAVCEQYPGGVLLFERLRKIKPKGGSRSRRRNRKQANQLRGKINHLAKEKAYAQGIVSVEVNPHGTSQYCARCGAKGLRFSLMAGQRVPGKGGKLFYCPACHYECHADFNASVNVHHSFFREFHWQPRVQKQRLNALSG
jgi:IS605 OrfB family transposase